MRTSTANPAETSKAGTEVPLRARPWRISPFLRLTLALHASALLALPTVPMLWPWIAGLLIVNHLLITVIVMRPRSTLFGPNIVRLPAAAIARREIALTFDDGPDPQVTPRVLDVLDRFGVKASFFCVASSAEKYPELVSEIVLRGHDVQNHSFGHAHSFPAARPSVLRRDVGRAQSTLASLAGTPPEFFRAPMGFRSPFLEPALAQYGLRFVSWTRRGFDTREKRASVVLSRLLTGLCAGDILLLHDRGSAITVSGEPVVLEVLPQLLERVAADGLRAVSLRQGLH